MAGRGLIIAGGIVAVARGGIQALTAVPLLGNQQLEALVPGIGAVIAYEFVMAVVLVIGGIFAIVKSAAPAAGKAIRMLGVVFIVLGAVDLIWSVVVVGSTATASGVGSLLGCALAGGLLIAGGMKLSSSAE